MLSRRRERVTAREMSLYYGRVDRSGLVIPMEKCKVRKKQRRSIKKGLSGKMILVAGIGL
jgi:hypothetical protein